MEPRLLFRTHYQVDEPVYMEFLIKLCTSPVKSAYKEVVARKLADEIQRRGRRFNNAAGGYAVDLARNLDLLTPNHSWSSKGFLVDLIAEVNDAIINKQVTLSLPEKILHFRLFLEADGAAFLYIARYLSEYGSLPKDGSNTNEFIKNMFIEILSDYLSITNNTAERVSLRNRIEKLRIQEYRGHSGSHKLFIHTQTLYRLNIIDRREPDSRTYCLPADNYMSKKIETLLASLPHITALEKVVSSHRLIEIAANVLQIPYVNWNHDYKGTSQYLLAKFYKRIMGSGIPLCTISTLLEAIQITMLSDGVLLKYQDALEFLMEIQKRNPREIRLHVNRRGEPAFIKISEDMINRLILEGAN